MDDTGTHGPWDFGDLDGYVHANEPGQVERAKNWQMAIGLQGVDGLSTSHYLLETAKEHVEGRIDIIEARRRIDSYYEERSGRDVVEGSSQADRVSARIAELLGERSFTFSPVQLQTIHRRLFDQILPHAGKYRAYNITKNEWVLKGETVYYASYDSIFDTLRYDFAQERDVNYAGLTECDAAHHIARFVSGIWQIHPFGEGNTRTTAVFAIKYLRSMGYSVDNKPFKENSWYFRNALVRANYEDVTRGISPSLVFLERFFENLLCGTNHELRNRYLHLDWPLQGTDQGDASKETSKETIATSKEIASKETTQGPSGVTREQVLTILREEPTSTAISIAERVGLTPQGVRYHLELLKKAGRIHHEGPTKSGRWVVHD